MNIRSILFALTVTCCLIASASVYLYFQYSSEQLDREAHNEGKRSVELIAREVDIYLQSQKRAAATAAGLPGLQAYLRDPAEAYAARGRQLLDLICSVNDASMCYLLNRHGEVLIHNSDIGGLAMQGKNFAFRPYFSGALDNTSALYLAHGAVSRQRGIYFSHRVEDTDGAPLGVVVVKLPADTLDKELSGAGRHLALVGPDGVIFAGNQSDWLLKSLFPLSEVQQASVVASRQFGDARVASIGLSRLAKEGHVELSGREFIMEAARLRQLEGWKVVLLGEGSYPSLFFVGRTVTVVVTILFMLAAVVVGALYWGSRRDDAHREEVESELEHSERRLRQLGEISNEGILIHRGGKILDSNGVAERMFGFSRRELLSMEVWDLLAPESVSVGFHNVHTGLELPYEVQAQRKDGSEFPMEVFAKNSSLEGEEVRVACLRDITEFKQQEATILYQSQFDLLTDLPNKQLLMERLRGALEHALSSGRKVAVLYIDLDDFKKINDSMGHDVGDQLLVEFSQRLLGITRIGDTLARHAADEFVMLMDEVDDERDVPRILEEILLEASREFDIKGRRFYISATVGIAVYPHDGQDEVSLLQHADIAMHRCKEEGGNSFGYYQSNMAESATVRIEMERYLRRAIALNELYLHYQPIYGTDDGRLLGAEVLVRWNSSELGFVGPDHFIPLAEQTGLIIEIGNWILRTACEQGRQWLDEGLREFYLAVNISPRQLRQKGFVEGLQQLLDETGFPAQALVLELTEGVLVRKDAGTRALLNQLKAMGVSLAMDDFGTGYSSLAYLKQFPFDVIKIDRSFIRDLGVDTSDQQLVVAAIEMARALGLKVVAEGVETAQQLHFLRDAGCYSVQGYYLSRPVEASQCYETVVVPRLGLEPAIRA